MRALKNFWEKTSWVTVFIFVISIVGAGVVFAAYTGNKAVTVGGRATYDIYDEDNMGSDDAYGLATQQSVKAFVNNYSGTTPTVVDLAGTSLYSVSAPGTYWIDDHESTLGTRVASGVSIQFYKITAALDNSKIRIMKKPVPWSGTTKIVITSAAWTSGTTDHFWNVTTGVTNESSGKIPPEISEIDAVGDWLEFTAQYGSTGSTWFQTGRYIQ